MFSSRMFARHMFPIRMFPIGGIAFEIDPIGPPGPGPRGRRCGNCHA